MGTTCSRCGKTLKNPEYISIGMGRVCAKKAGVLGGESYPLFTEEVSPKRKSIIVRITCMFRAFIMDRRRK